MSDELKEIERCIQEIKKKFTTCKYSEIKALELKMYFFKKKKHDIELKLSSGRQKISDLVDVKINIEPAGFERNK